MIDFCQSGFSRLQDLIKYVPGGRDWQVGSVIELHKERPVKWSLGGDIVNR